jgi:hypothetical protein
VPAPGHGDHRTFEAPFAAGEGLQDPGTGIGILGLDDVPQGRRDRLAVLVACEGTMALAGSRKPEA